MKILIHADINDRKTATRKLITDARQWTLVTSSDAIKNFWGDRMIHVSPKEFETRKTYEQKGLRVLIEGVRGSFTKKTWMGQLLSQAQSVIVSTSGLFKYPEEIMKQFDTVYVAKGKVDVMELYYPLFLLGGTAVDKDKFMSAYETLRPHEHLKFDTVTLEFQMEMWVPLAPVKPPPPAPPLRPVELKKHTRVSELKLVPPPPKLVGTPSDDKTKMRVIMFVSPPEHHKELMHHMKLNLDTTLFKGLMASFGITKDPHQITYHFRVRLIRQDLFSALMMNTMDYILHLKLAEDAFLRA